MGTHLQDEASMSFWGHMEELRKRVVSSVIAIGIGFVACFSFSEQILGLLLLPMNASPKLSSAFPFLSYEPNEKTHELFFTTLTEPFLSHLKIGLIASLMLAMPVILQQVWRFVSPGLYERERRYGGWFVILSSAFFLFGVLFCYFVLLPVAIPFLVSYKTEHLTPIIRIGEYIDFSLKFLLAAGAVFELPLVLLLLGRLGVVQHGTLAKNRKYAVLIAFVLGGLLTPTPDVFNMTLLSVPIYLLYEVGLLGVRFFGKEKRTADPPVA